MNKLPEKLTQLRKYNGFSQQTVAEKAQVSVLDYMAWEKWESDSGCGSFDPVGGLFQYQSGRNDPQRGAGAAREGSA